MPWNDPRALEERDRCALDRITDAGFAPLSPFRVHKNWARSCTQTIETKQGLLWIKHGYGLPPGEEEVLSRLVQRWPRTVPDVVATWPGGFAMRELDGHELEEDGPTEQWIEAARTLGEVLHGETQHVEKWLALGVRDRRPARWRGAIEDLLASPVLEDLESSVRSRFEEFTEGFVTRYENAFHVAPTLVHQDSGCCNIQVTKLGPVLFDWADVVVGHPAFSLDRLLDQVAQEDQPPVIHAFLEATNCPENEWQEMRRSNVLHEVLRYHDELQYIAQGDPARISLANSVCSQIQVLVEFETRRLERG